MEIIAATIVSYVLWGAVRAIYYALFGITGWYMNKTQEESIKYAREFYKKFRHGEEKDLSKDN